MATTRRHTDSRVLGKAIHLILMGRVRRVQDARCYEISGDHGTYFVFVRGPRDAPLDRAVCTCLAGAHDRVCSHKLAALHLDKGSDMTLFVANNHDHAASVTDSRWRTPSGRVLEEGKRYAYEMRPTFVVQYVRKTHKVLRLRERMYVCTEALT